MEHGSHGSDEPLSAEARWPPSQRLLEAGIDFDRPNAARVYDYLLGGAHNFEVDRAMIREMLEVHPEVAQTARANRAFVGRAVRWCVDQGIDQFLDLGSGVPTVGNVHEIAHDRNPVARIAYVDFESVAVAHAEEIIQRSGIGDTVTITRADLRDPDAVLSAPGVASLLDLARPTALLAASVLHFVTDDEDPKAILARYYEALTAGSVAVMSHSSHDIDDEVQAARMREVAAVFRNSATPPTQRSRPELLELMAGVDLVPPGLVDVVNWPEDTGSVSGHYGAVGHLRRG